MTVADDLVSVCRSLFERGLTPGTSGNVSVRTPDGLLITPTGTCMGRLGLDDVVTVAMSGAVLDGPVPSKETPLHIAAYRRTDAAAVVHLHSPYATAVSCLAGLDPDAALGSLTGYHALKVGRMARVPYRPPGSPALAEAVEQALGSDVRSLLMANHGSLAAGADLEAAADSAEQIEQSAHIYLLVGGRAVERVGGGEPR